MDGKKRTESGFDAKREIDRITEWIREWFSENGPEANAVIGISGGKDSSVCAALLIRALGSGRVLGVLMPDKEQADIADSHMIAEYLGLRHVTVNIGAATAALTATLSEQFTLSKDSRINLPPRIRMTTLYAIAQSIPGGGRVANTCNLSEDYIGYSTKYGDAAGDFGILADYTVKEVLMIGEELGLPGSLVHKTPSDGLSGLSDEDKIGFTYAALDRYIREGICEDESIREKIDRMHRLNEHKLKPIPHPSRN
ncbi:MAG: NAD(+) synthase [Lachnospiraceae bacterium]|nr:NAD(+) synthase [Lachnospiraceae bacterium]